MAAPPAIVAAFNAPTPSLSSSTAADDEEDADAAVPERE